MGVSDIICGSTSAEDQNQLMILIDIKGSNIFLEMEDNTMLDRYVQAEIQSPSPRKIVDGKIVYRTRLLEPASRLRAIELGDFGSAVPGDAPRNGQFIQPSLYRAPEVILEKEWNYPIDIWNLATWVGYALLSPKTPYSDIFGNQAWHAFQAKPMFEVVYPNHDSFSTCTHLAQITGLLGPPPPDFVEPDTISAHYFDERGQ